MNLLYFPRSPGAPTADGTGKTAHCLYLCATCMENVQQPPAAFWITTNKNKASSLAIEEETQDLLLTPHTA